MEAILNNLIKATGWSIFHSLWQGAIIYGILLLAVNTFPRMQAKSKHNLAFGALLLMFVGYVVTFSSIFTIPSPAQQGATGLAVNAGEQHGIYQMTWSAALNNRAEHMFPYLVAVYSIGLILQLFILSKGYLKLKELKKGPHEQVPAAWQATFQALIEKLALKQNVTFKLSSYVNVPLVIGYLKPIVLFPVALVNQLDMNQVEAILIHELSHIRRNDYLLNLFKTAIETILFFNPFVWFSTRLINIEREHACDDLVLKLTGTPVTYAHALLKLEVLKDKGSPALAMASTGKNQHLYQRIKRITDMKTNYMNAKQQFFAVTLTVATVISLAWVSPQKKDKKVKLVVKTSTAKSVGSISMVLTPAVALKIDTIPKKTAKQDSTKKKGTMKIVTVDGQGNKVTYNSVYEMPDSLKSEVFKNSKFDLDFTFDHKALDSAITNSFVYLKSPEFVLQLKNMTDVAKSELVLKEYKNMAEQSKLYFNSPEWKDKTLLLLKDQSQLNKSLSLEIKEAVEQSKKIGQQLKLNSLDQQEYKKQLEALKELQSSEEYKQLKQKFDKDLEQLKEKKGIKKGVKTGGLNYLEIWPSRSTKF